MNVDSGARPRRAPARHTPTDPPDASFLTVDQFAARIGCTTRTVRSYHSRGLLQPPVRVGRTPYYLRRHLARIRRVLGLQSRGLPLEAIRALLDPDLVLDESFLVTKAVDGAVRGKPRLLAVLVDAGVLTLHPDGTLHVHGVRAILAARTAVAPAAPLTPALRLLTECVRRVRPHAGPAADELRDLLGARPTHEELVELLVESFRLSLLHPGIADADPRTS
ncbi:MerR family transcriptional regulator [Actinokineospora sp. PR83]|uniref:MerR family transcriptional regulator n=1 Tax=Actinokineospora sp. PR83 TaxID=2884908 RepID=UPI001F3EB432|nr:MerR family transcriptional regulator [Actinokineospora sp. PR83]MCG8914301.1 MerR family transcriptional regulator [Actinokineospora sp. PR83]